MISGVQKQHIHPGAHLCGEVDKNGVLHVGGDDVVAPEVLVGPPQQLLGRGVLQFGGAAFGQRAQRIEILGGCLRAHRKSASSARTAHCAKRSPSARCATKLRTTRSM
ncbi:Uncharacterised protein [Mycobacteroides abscessus subsp. abscessus]|nr:Uncharacterised protein [Mycobacteroides abscessus subsp. abscessus]SKW57914.1 Uncharacterised protein [Mycobacteroides abscessus subsp. abscessus]